jgi:hypothetical protein
MVYKALFLMANILYIIYNINIKTNKVQVKVQKKKRGTRSTLHQYITNSKKIQRKRRYITTKTKTPQSHHHEKKKIPNKKDKDQLRVGQNNKRTSHPPDPSRPNIESC